MEMKNCAMVLEGGAMKGIYTAGVLDYLMEEKFLPEYVIGVSAGACSAVGYIADQPGRTRACFLTQKRDEQYLKMTNVLHRKPIYDMDMVFDRFPNERYPFDFETFFASPVSCEIVVTNCLDGKAEYMTPVKEKKQLMDLCRASSSLPLIAPEVIINQIPYMDGGMADPIPIKRAIEKGYKKQIIVLTKNYGYRKELKRAMCNMIVRKYHNYPDFCKTVVQRYKRYNQTMEYIERLEEKGKIFVMRPQRKAISRMEKNRRKMSAFYEDGYQGMRARYDEFLEYLNR